MKASMISSILHDIDILVGPSESILNIPLQHFNFPQLLLLLFLLVSFSIKRLQIRKLILLPNAIKGRPTSPDLTHLIDLVVHRRLELLLALASHLVHIARKHILPLEIKVANGSHLGI